MEKGLFLLDRILTKSKAFLAMLVYTQCIGLQGVNASANALSSLSKEHGLYQQATLFMLVWHS